MDDNETLCARCARCQTTCCSNEIYITPGDVRRIAAFTGLSGFWEYQHPVDPGYLDQDDDPAWAAHVIRPDKTRRELHRVQGNCMFLGFQGCLLPLEVRPLVCRLFPYDYIESGIKAELAAGCPRFLLAPGQDLIAELGMNLDDARRWHRQLYEEIRLEKTLACTSV